MLTEMGMPRVPEVRSGGRAGGGLVLGLLSPCHIESMYELCRGVETQKTRADRCNTKHVHHGFKFGRLAELVMVLIMHPCIQPKPRVQCLIQQGGSYGHRLSCKAIGSQPGASHIIMGLPGTAVRISRATWFWRAIHAMISGPYLIGDLLLDNNPPLFTPK